MNSRQRRYKRRHPSLKDIMIAAIREEIDKEILEKLRRSYVLTYPPTPGVSINIADVNVLTTKVE